VTTHIDHVFDEECRRFQDSFELVGKRWSPAILMAITLGSHRFSEILRRVEGLSDRLLAQRLKELEASDLISREVIPTVPVQIRYALTERGADLMRSLQPLVAWGLRWEPPRPNVRAVS
jgi:DNA-binding HxlR family transcriptional regulator